MLGSLEVCTSLAGLQRPHFDDRDIELIVERSFAPARPLAGTKRRWLLELEYTVCGPAAAPVDICALEFWAGRHACCETTANPPLADSHDSGSIGLKGALRDLLTVVLVGVSAVLDGACRGEQAPNAPSDLPQYIVDELKNASDFEREILEDGVVTADEYEKAVMGTLRCLDEHGVAHSAPALVGEGGLMPPKLKYTVGPWPEQEDEKYSKIYHDCFDEYERGPLTGWTLQSEPSQSDLERANERIVECLAEHGVEFRDYDAFAAVEGTLAGQEADVAAKCRLLILRGVNWFE